MRGAPVRHVALLKLRAEHSLAVADELADDLRALLAAAGGDGVVTRDLGLRPGHERTAEVLLEAVFEDRDAFRAYLASAPHQAFLSRWVSGEGIGILAIQIPADET